MTRTFRVTTAVMMVALPALATAQINFSKNGYYVAMGDSVAAGEGAQPVTSGYPYQLYDQSRFDHRQQMEFANSRCARCA